MPRQREIPKINSVTVIYNGDGKTFDTFMESMINDYLNSDSIATLSFYRPPLNSAGTLWCVCVTYLNFVQIDTTTSRPESPAITLFYQQVLPFQ